MIRRLRALGCLLGATLAARGEGAELRPNFVVIMAEAQAWAGTSVQMDDQVPASRSSVFKTPGLERLAREGMRFASGYAASPRCTPSRAALFTGRSPAALRMTYVGAGRESPAARAGYRLLPPEPLLELPEREVTVGEMLQSAGYATAHFGKWHVGRVSPARHGFQESDGPTNNGGPDNVASPNPKEAFGMTERGIAFAAKAQQAGKPFYLQLSHYPNQDQKGPRSSAEEMSASTDQSLERLLAALDRLGLTANTYVFYTADHGAPGRGNEPLSGGKGAVTEGGLRVPFLVRGPGIPAGVCSRVPVTGMDLFPTIAALAGTSAALPPGVEGGSLVSVLRDRAGAGQVTRARDVLVFHFPHYDLGNGGPVTAIMLGQMKLIRQYETGKKRLYDLSRDGPERHDLAAERPEVVQALEARLDAYLREVSAQMAAPNPDFDPTKAGSAEDDGRKGGKGGGKGGGKKR